MSPEYPIYLRDRHGWMLVVANADDLPWRVEQPEAEEGELVGWDSRVFPLRISWDGKRPVVVGLVDERDDAGLRAALLRFAEHKRVEVDLGLGSTPQGERVNIDEAWKRLESALEARRTWLQRLARRIGPRAVLWGIGGVVIPLVLVGGLRGAGLIGIGNSTADPVVLLLAGLLAAFAPVASGMMMLVDGLAGSKGSEWWLVPGVALACVANGIAYAGLAMGLDWGRRHAKWLAWVVGGAWGVWWAIVARVLMGANRATGAP